MGFSIWTQELQPKQIINAIFDSVNYTEKFEQDIVESEKNGGDFQSGYQTG